MTYLYDILSEIHVLYIRIPIYIVCCMYDIGIKPQLHLSHIYKYIDEPFKKEMYTYTSNEPEITANEGKSPELTSKQYGKYWNIDSVYCTCIYTIYLPNGKSLKKRDFFFCAGQIESLIIIINKRIFREPTVLKPLENLF